MDSVLEWALAYAELGWHVFPVNEDKTPATGNGWHDATSEPSAIRAMDWQGKQIGVATLPSGLVVVDVDIKPAKGGKPAKNGALWIRAMEAEHEDLARDVEARTGSGGEHIFFRAPDGAPIHMLGRGCDVDIIGKGYVLVEPSRNEAGSYYWMEGCSPLDTHAELPECPEWIVDFVRRWTRGRVDGGPADRNAGPAPDLATDEDIAEIKAALATLDPNMDRETWLRAGMAINAATGGSSRGFRLWDEWSQGGASYDAKHIRRDWTSFDPWGDVTMGSLVHIARERGGFDGEAWRRERSIEAAREAIGDEWADALAQALEDVQRKLGTSSAGSATPIAFETLAELMQREFEPTQWLVRGLITREAVFAISGEPKTSKTWAGLELLEAIASGTMAFGEFEAVGKHEVAAFLAEDTARAARNRLVSLAAGGGRRLDGFAERVSVHNLGSLDLGDVGHLARLVASVRLQHPNGIGALYLDPLRDLHAEDENDSGGMGKVMAALRCLRSVLGCAVLFVHHSSKGGQGTSGRRPGQMMRGSSAIHGAVDGGLYLYDLDTDGRSYWWNTAATEVKAARGAGEFGLELEIRDNDAGEAEHAAWTHHREKRKAKPAPTESKYAKAIADHLEAELESGNMDGESMNALTQAVGFNRRTVEKYAQILVDEGVLTRCNKGRLHYVPAHVRVGGVVHCVHGAKKSATQLKDSENS